MVDLLVWTLLYKVGNILPNRRTRRAVALFNEVRIWPEQRSEWSQSRDIGSMFHALLVLHMPYVAGKA